MNPKHIWFYASYLKNLSANPLVMYAHLSRLIFKFISYYTHQSHTHAKHEYTQNHGNKHTHAHRYTHSHFILEGLVRITKVRIGNHCAGSLICSCRGWAEWQSLRLDRRRPAVGRRMPEQAICRGEQIAAERAPRITRSQTINLDQ